MENIHLSLEARITRIRRDSVRARSQVLLKLAYDHELSGSWRNYMLILGLE